VSNIIWVDAISINTFTNNPTWDFRNEFTAHYTGLEGAVKGQWDETSLTFNFARQLARADLTTSSTFLPAYAESFSKTTPRNSGSLLLIDKMNEGVSLSAGYYYQGVVKVLDGVYPQPIMRRLDLRLAKQFRSMGDKSNGGVELALVVQNALQSNIVGYSGYIFGRRAYVTATTIF
jgi:hypothetical protein